MRSLFRRLSLLWDRLLEGCPQIPLLVQVSSSSVDCEPRPLDSATILGSARGPGYANTSRGATPTRTSTPKTAISRFDLAETACAVSFNAGFHGFSFLSVSPLPRSA